MARRKIVLVIVEGASDETALGITLNQVFDKDTVHIHIMHGDITTRRGVSQGNIVTKLADEVKRYAASNHYEASDFKQIIHVVDTDGAYLADDKIVEDSTCQKLSYQDDGIHTDNTSKVISRNQQKRKNLDKLTGKKEIWDIPYRVYYMSCNLDHVLYGKRNSTDQEKETDAYAFAKKYRNDADAFVKFMCQSPFSVNRDFEDSWKFIKSDMRSVERYTNFPVCLMEEQTTEQGER